MESSLVDIEAVFAAGIPDIAAVYGGVRGATMSSQRQRRAWPIVKSAGITVIIDLREDGLCSKMPGLCREFGIDYFHYPLDNRCKNTEVMVDRFGELCRLIDNGRFYIGCAMGLHRTDCALALYWVFHGADRGVDPPEIRGYRKSLGLTSEKIVRVLNGFYSYVGNGVAGQPVLSPDEFNRRKAVIKSLVNNS